MKKIISAVIVITIVINVIGAGFLNVRASAEVATAVVVSLCSVIIGVLSGIAGDAITRSVPELENLDVQGMINYRATHNGEVIEINEDMWDQHKYFVPADNLDSEQAEFAQYLCDHLNESGAVEQYIQGYNQQYDGISSQIEVSASTYTAIKNSILHSFNDYINAKASAEAASGVGSSLSELGAVTYPFDFTGPLPSLTLPTTSGAVSLDMNGFHFTPPYTIGLSESYSTEEQAINHGGSIVQQSGSSYIPYQSYNAYGYGFYVIYGGEMYFNGGYSANRDISTMTVRSQQPDFNTWNSSSWVSASGVRLCDVHTFTIDEIDNGALVGGIMFHTEYKDWDHRFPFSYSYSPEDFIVAELGDDITLDRTPAEDSIGSAMGLGLVSSNPTLTIDTTTGEITAADNIDLATLESLIEKLSEGQLKFDDIEGYLQSIVALLQAQGADQKTISAILQGIRSNTSSIADINAAVQSISDAMSIEAEAEIELPDVDAEAFIVNHTGLPEATTIVNGIPVVGQITQLLNNVLDSSQYSSGAPNFKFYWDSDGDGTREVYNALDLSFLDNRIASDTLSDSGRLSDSMTYRQFLHALIIFLCYVGFAIKIIKKLPSLFGASESFNEFVSSDK